ncbi:hypothetical protein [Streptomyces sp. NPDC004726]
MLRAVAWPDQGRAVRADPGHSGRLWQDVRERAGLPVSVRPEFTATAGVHGAGARAAETR